MGETDGALINLKAIPESEDFHSRNRLLLLLLLLLFIVMAAAVAVEVGVSAVKLAAIL
jgi:hypothetical protein